MSGQNNRTNNGGMLSTGILPNAKARVFHEGR